MALPHNYFARLKSKSKLLDFSLAHNYKMSNFLWSKQITNPAIKGFTFLVISAIVVGVGILAMQKVKDFPTASTRKISMGETLKDKKVAMIIAFRDFRDEEYFIPKEVLETAGAEIKTISTKMGEAIGSQGGEAEVDITLGELRVSDFDAIVFIGGQGASEYLDSDTSYKIAQEAVSEKKILAAICIAPTILAKAGVLSEKKATVWSSLLDKKAVKVLKENGVIYQDDPIVVDGNIVTGNGPGAAKEFGEAIFLLLEG